MFGRMASQNSKGYVKIPLRAVKDRMSLRIQTKTQRAGHSKNLSQSREPNGSQSRAAAGHRTHCKHHKVHLT